MFVSLLLQPHTSVKSFNGQRHSPNWRNSKVTMLCLYKLVLLVHETICWEVVDAPVLTFLRWKNLRMRTACNLGIKTFFVSYFIAFWLYSCVLRCELYCRVRPCRAVEVYFLFVICMILGNYAMPSTAISIHFSILAPTRCTNPLLLF